MSSTEAAVVEELSPSSWTKSIEELQDLYAVACPLKKVSKLLAALSRHFPLGNQWHHVKRARKSQEDCVEVILSINSELSPEQTAFLETLEVPRALHVVQVTKHVPRTSEEAKRLSTLYWPLVFRKGRTCWNPTPLTPEQQQLAISRTQKLFQTFQTPDKLPVSDRVVCSVAAAIYLHDTLIATGLNRTMYEPETAHLLTHAPFEALKQLSDQVLELCKVKRLKRGKPEAPKVPIENEKELQNSQYYALDCEVFLVGEPCLMCAMALVHSRVKMVYLAVKGSGDSDKENRGREEEKEKVPMKLEQYVAGKQWQNPWNGGFGSLGEHMAVQWILTLNHHYTIYVVRDNENDSSCSAGVNRLEKAGAE